VREWFFEVAIEGTKEDELRNSWQKIGMMLMTSSTQLRAVLLCATLAVTPKLFAQESAGSERVETENLGRRLSFGLRVRAVPVGLLGDDTLERSQTTPARSWTFTTTSRSPRMGLGPVVEFRLTRRLSVRTELLFHRFRYDKVTEMYQGTDNPDTTTDERTKTTTTERTKANYWDIPVLLCMRGIRQTGLLSKLYLSGGYTLRSVSHVRTGTETAFPDDTNDYHERPAMPESRNLSGATAGAGFRFVDALNIKVTPEIRYTRWLGATFSSEALRSGRGQIEAGIGLTF
jgi:hypothetical protein